MRTDVQIQHLASRRDLLPQLAQWFCAEWPDWYGAGGPGDIMRDLAQFSASAGRLPVGIVASLRGEPVGAAVLKAESIPTHAHLSPWAAAGYVLPGLRGQGIGAVLLVALVREAARLGYPRVYCATGSAVSLLQRNGWSVKEELQHAGQALSLLEKAT